MDSSGNVEIGNWPESVGWITYFSGRKTWGPVVVVCRLFKIMVYLYQI